MPLRSGVFPSNAPSQIIGLFNLNYIFFFESKQTINNLNINSLEISLNIEQTETNVISVESAYKKVFETSCSTSRGNKTNFPPLLSKDLLAFKRKLAFVFF